MRLFVSVLRNALALGKPSVTSERSSVSVLRHVMCTIALLLCAVAVSAQVETGQVAGTVTDQSGAVIPGAKVTARNLATNATRSTQSNPTGAYLLPGLEPSTYEITVKSEGFRPLAAKVEIAVGARVTVDAKLSVSSDVTQVEVTADSVAQINTQTQEISQVVDTQQLAELPSLTRNPYDFVAISGNISNGDAGSSGSSSNGSNSQNSSTRGVGFNINGQRSSGTEILLDGVENIAAFSDGIGTAVPMDGIQEYRVVTSDFQAEFGRASGGVVNVTTKGGGNQYHGTAWEYNRLSAYTSNTETNDQMGRPKGTYTRNQFGFSAGGPIKKDKLFLFGTNEWTRVRSSAQLLGGVPTPEFLSAANSNIQNYFNQYGGGKTFSFVKTYTADQVYGSYNAKTPTGLPGSTPMMGVVSYQAPQNAGGGLPQNTYNFMIRADYNLSDKTNMYGRVVDYHEDDFTGAGFASPYSQYNVGTLNKNQAYLFSLSHVFSPSLTSSTKLSFSRFDTKNSYDKSLNQTPTLTVYPMAYVTQTSSVQVALPGFYDTNPAQGGLPAGGPENTAQINQDVTWIKGNHSIQGGAQLVYIQENQAFGAYAQAEEQLGNNATNGFTALYTGNLYQFEVAVNPQGHRPCATDPYTGALPQDTSSCNIQLPASQPNFARSDRFKDAAFYAQDSWKTSSKLTLNYGVRWEYYGVQHNNHSNLDSNFYYGAGSTLAERIRNGQVYSVPESPIHKLWNPTYGAVSPRVGFAYDLTGNGRDSIRGGWGIAYERNFGNVTFNLIQNPPNYAVMKIKHTTVTNSNLGPMGASSGTQPLKPTTLRQVDPDIKTAQTQFWSLAIEHQLNHSTMVSAQYVGARGIHLYDIKNYNGQGSGNAQLGDSYNDPDGSGNQALTRLNRQYSDINNRGSGADSYYHGVNVQFQTTDLHQTGLSMVANYTFSHEIDDLSTTFSESSAGNFNLGYTDPFNPAMDRGNGELDVRQRVVVAPMYSEPYFKHGSTLTKTALADWKLSGIFTAHTGTPFSYFDTTNNASGYNVPRYTPSAPLTKHSFTSIPHGVTGGGSNNYVLGSLPLANSWGNANLGGASDWGPWPASMTGRDSFRGPGMWNLDAVLSKTVQFHDRFSMEFRAEGFNVLNHHNLFLQEGNFDAGSYAGTNPQITASKGGIGNNGGANDERRFGQFSLKLSY